MAAIRVWLITVGTSEVVCAATSKRAAAAAMGHSLYAFNQYAGELSPTHPIAPVALARPGVALARPNARYYADPTAEWKAL